MEIRVGQVVVHYVEHGTGRPVLVLHGAGVDHRETEACFEPALDGVAGLRRIYPDLPGMGRSTAPGTLRSADDVLDTLLGFADEVTGGSAYLLAGHSAGAYYAQAMAARRQAQVAGLALVCPLLPRLRDVPEHRVVAGSGEIGDDVFRSYFVIQTPEMLERYERYVAPAAALVDEAALERIGERWALTPDDAPAYAGPTAVVAGRLDSTVGYAAAVDLVDHYPHASLAVVDDAGHALPHERPELLRALLADWIGRVVRVGRSSRPETGS
ncbi:MULTISPECIES: alpha/beta fold hydrolase [unclassified Streptomyces]|uniref:alpha/beta fold hydrolase n=1 Tax=unclassified Streptomyces TaxID=2593676 RepID=UPI0028882A30|nr:alpha/beta hydrolase [Streptomyces sp. DSM 41633]